MLAQWLSNRLPGLDIPQDNRLVIAARCQDSSIRAEGNTANYTCMAIQRLIERLLCCYTPQNHFIISATRHKHFPVWAEGNTGNRRCMPAQGLTDTLLDRKSTRLNSSH